MASLIVTTALMVGGGTPIELPSSYKPYKPRFNFCNTRSCDQRAARRKVQARHKAEVRWRAHMRNVVDPHRGWLAALRMCESTNNYRANTGNGFYGAYQFTPNSWAAVGGRGYPHLASPLEQDYRAVKLLRLQGSGAWPNCP